MHLVASRNIMNFQNYIFNEKTEHPMPKKSETNNKNSDSRFLIFFRVDIHERSISSTRTVIFQNSDSGKIQYESIGAELQNRISKRSILTVSFVQIGTDRLLGKGQKNNGLVNLEIRNGLCSKWSDVIVL